MKISAVISPHGFGHASRAVAVIQSLHRTIPNCQFDVITTVPEWFFKDSLKVEEYHYIAFETDVGVVQHSPFVEDLPGTVDRLKGFVPFGNQKVEYLANLMKERKTDLVLCDISPLGIAAANRANIPSILVENFTWDWIYEGYLDLEPRLRDFIQPLREAFGNASIHIQTEPVCEYKPAHLVTQPVSRLPRTPRDEMRQSLGVSPHQPLVLITMGGIPHLLKQLQPLHNFSEVVFVIPGASERYEQWGNLLLLPHHHPYYHPDLVNASDVVVGKLGYSTIAEAYHSGVPYLYIPRNHFRETSPLAAFVERELNGLRVEEQDFYNGRWLDRLPPILSLARKERERLNGSAQIAEWIAEKLGLGISHLQ
ncbi:MAG: glycosyltransferase family protein [Chloroflexota bacterium]